MLREFNISKHVIRRQCMDFRKCPGLGSTAKWSPCVSVRQCNVVFNSGVDVLLAPDEAESLVFTTIWLVHNVVTSLAEHQRTFAGDNRASECRDKFTY